MKNSDNNKKTAADTGDSADQMTLAKKLEALLLLLYQAFLKGETDLDPEIKASIFRRVDFSREFALKVRMIQSDYFDTGRKNTREEWNHEVDVLFPSEVPTTTTVPTIARQESIANYKAMVLKLL